MHDIFTFATYFKATRRGIRGFKSVISKIYLEVSVNQVFAKYPIATGMSAGRIILPDKIKNNKIILAYSL